MAISAVIPQEVHWIVTAAWTYPDWLRSHFLTPASHWSFQRVANVYGFTTMPPMPPRPEDTQRRARSVRKVLSYARKVEQAIIGLAPEGRDSPEGGLCTPPPGTGRFMLHLADMKFDILPVGVFEHKDELYVRFGPGYRLPTSQDPGLADLPVDGRDRYISRTVMERIARMVPERLRGEF